MLGRGGGVERGVVGRERGGVYACSKFGGGGGGGGRGEQKENLIQPALQCFGIRTLSAGKPSGNTSLYLATLNLDVNKFGPVHVWSYEGDTGVPLRLLERFPWSPLSRIVGMVVGGWGGGGWGVRGGTVGNPYSAEIQHHSAIIVLRTRLTNRFDTNKKSKQTRS